VELPVKLGRVREELLTRAKNILSVTRTSSPDYPYLDMNSGPKTLLLMKNGTELNEYVGMEGSGKQSHQDYYETCENQSKIPPSVLSKSLEEHTDHDLRQEAQKLIRIYEKLSAVQARDKCHKCGPLYRKEGKKLFLSESRACWIALVGSHLLIYRNERHNRPYAIYPIRGYMVRAAPNLMPRDRQKKESAFEIYKPGNETLQFIARTPKDMDQWIAKVYEVCCKENVTSNANSNVEIRAKRRITHESSPWMNRYENNRKTQHQDAIDKSMATNKSIESLADHHKDEKNKQEKDTVKNPLPLPSRIPRRLPSLPPDSAIASYKVAVDDDDDDDEIYHKIEDLINGTYYQNLALRRRRNINEQQDTYDDIHGPNDKSGEQMEAVKSNDTTLQEETYDDIGILSRINVNIARTEFQDNQNDNGSVIKKEREELYDDVEVRCVYSLYFCIETGFRCRCQIK